jgi:hypothetical protein
MPIIDGVNPDKSIRVYDKFYNFDIVVNASEYDIIRSYFFDLSNNADVADNFTVMVFRIANLSDIQPLEIYKQMKSSTTKLEVTAMMAYYLNNLKTKTSLYGIGVNPIPNQTVQRNVVL